MTSDGSRKKLSDLSIGDEVLSVNNQGALEFSPVILFLDRDPKEQRQFYHISTEAGQALTLTPSHLIYASTEAIEASRFEAIYAKDIREGDFILVHNGQGNMKPVRVTDVEMRVLTGVFAPLTSAGNLVVDDVLASCYAVVDSQAVAHAAFAPMRWYSSLFAKLDLQNGIHWYADALYRIGDTLMPRHLSLP